MALEDLIERIEIARSRIEAQLRGAAVINVASARAEDGASALAAVLAHSFSRAGHPTLLVEGRAGGFPTFGVSAITEEAIVPKIRRARQGSPDTLRLDAAPPRSLGETKEMYGILRSRYAISISSHSVATEPGMMGLASLADVVLISVKKGRPARDEDRQLTELLHAAGAPVLGVVMLEAEAVATVEAWQNSAPILFAEPETAVKRKRLGASIG